MGKGTCERCKGPTNRPRAKMCRNCRLEARKATAKTLVCGICGTVVPRYYTLADGRRRARRGKGCCKSHGIQLALKEGRWHLPNPPNSWGATNTNWKGGIKWVGEYKMIRVPPGTPGATRRGYMMEHRYVMQTHIGRPLQRHELIHHRNANPKDNRLENLEIVTHKTHMREIVCPHCQRPFQIK